MMRKVQKLEVVQWQLERIFFVPGIAVILYVYWSFPSLLTALDLRSPQAPISWDHLPFSQDQLLESWPLGPICDSLVDISNFFTVNRNKRHHLSNLNKADVYIIHLLVWIHAILVMFEIAASQPINLFLLSSLTKLLWVLIWVSIEYGKFDLKPLTNPELIQMVHRHTCHAFMKGTF